MDFKPNFSKYYGHYKYDNGWKPYLIYYEVKNDITDMDSYTVDIYDDFGAKETYKYQFISFTNGQEDLFFKPLSFEYLLNRNSMEKDIFLEHPSDNILGIPIRYQKFKLNEVTGEFELVEKSYAQYAQGINVQRYSFIGNDSTIIFDGTLGINIHQKVDNYTFKDNLGINHTGEYEYADDGHVVKETVKEQNNVKSVIEYKYTPDDAEGLLKFEYSFRDGQGAGETQILEFAYADPLSNDNIQFSTFEVFPNPVDKEFNFNLNGQNSSGKILVFNAKGTVVNESRVKINNGTGKIILESLNPGTYSILIQSEGKYYRTSFIKL